VSAFTDQVTAFFAARGYDRNAIAGILGNSEQESTDNFGAAGGGAFQQRSAFGSGTGGSAANQLQTLLIGLNPFRSQLNAAPTPAAAADLVEQDYEKAGIPALGNRERYAQQAAVGLRGRQGTAGASGTALSRMRAEANALIGYPYTWGGGHISLGVPSGSPPGFDCSGYWSAILGAGGYLTAPQITGTLHTSGTLAPGPGIVTIYDRWNSDGNDHVIGNIAGTWYESGGTTTSGPHVMSAAAAAAQLAQGGFEPFHPAGMTRRTIGSDNDAGYGGTRPGGGTWSAASSAAPSAGTSSTTQNRASSATPRTPFTAPPIF
jgi:cell wall-associated NlpC family hydrolase